MPRAVGSSCVGACGPNRDSVSSAPSGRSPGQGTTLLEAGGGGFLPGNRISKFPNFKGSLHPSRHRHNRRYQFEDAESPPPFQFRKVEESVRVISIIGPDDKYHNEREWERRSMCDRSPFVECPSKESDKDDTNPGASLLKPRSCPKRTNRR